MDKVDRRVLVQQVLEGTEGHPVPGARR